MRSDRSKAGLLSKAIVVLGLISGFLAFTGIPRLRADNDDCQRRIARADHRLHEAIEHHGYQSEQVEHARHDLREARERWSSGHRWWDEDQHRWHTERDWDDEDHAHWGNHDRDDHH
jgi:hypothetical protein